MLRKLRNPSLNKRKKTKEQRLEESKPLLPFYIVERLNNQPIADSKPSSEKKPRKPKIKDEQPDNKTEKKSKTHRGKRSKKHSKPEGVSKPEKEREACY
ncbi:hypothetical protein QTN25_001305 [Entamoeba marina]